MSIKQELEKLKEIDVWSLMLFVLFKVKDVPEFSSLSELAYILDKKNLVKFLEYFGGSTIKVPTIDELESMIYGLLLYQYVDIEKMPLDDAITVLRVDEEKEKECRKNYKKVQTILQQYTFEPRSRI